MAAFVYSWSFPSFFNLSYHGKEGGLPEIFEFAQAEAVNKSVDITIIFRDQPKLWQQLARKRQMHLSRGKALNRNYVETKSLWTKLVSISFVVLARQVFRSGIAESCPGNFWWSLHPFPTNRYGTNHFTEMVSRRVTTVLMNLSKKISAM